MTKKGDMLYAWTNDAEIQKKADSVVQSPACGNMPLRPRWLTRCSR